MKTGLPRGSGATCAGARRPAEDPLETVVGQPGGARGRVRRRSRTASRRPQHVGVQAFGVVLDPQLLLGRAHAHEDRSGGGVDVSMTRSSWACPARSSRGARPRSAVAMPTGEALGGLAGDARLAAEKIKGLTPSSSSRARSRIQSAPVMRWGISTSSALARADAVAVAVDEVARSSTARSSGTSRDWLRRARDVHHLARRATLADPAGDALEQLVGRAKVIGMSKMRDAGRPWRSSCALLRYR